LKLIIAGSTKFNDYEMLESCCDKLLEKVNDVEIVSGKAPGADSLGCDYAKAKGYTIKPFPAKWDDLTHPDAVIKTNRWGKKYDAKAGPRRNEEMAKYADELIAFWDYKSPGTKSMVKLAEKYRLRVTIVNFK